MTDKIIKKPETSLENEVDASRRDFLILASTAAGASALSPLMVEAKPLEPVKRKVPIIAPTQLPEGYNILLVTVDQERFFEGGYPFPVPGRERLMREGITFIRHENNSNVCTSSRSVMYTGWHMPKTRMFDNTGLPWTEKLSLDPALGTLGTLLTEAGYYSAYKGKWHLSAELDAIVDPQDLGRQPTVEMHKIMEGYGFKDFHGIGDVIGWSQGGYLHDAVTAGQTINWLRSNGQQLNEKGKPWFLALNLVNPHDVMFIDTDEPGERVQWQGPLNNGGVGPTPAQPPKNKLYSSSWNEVPLPPSRHQPLDEPGRPAAHLEYQLARGALEGQFPDEDRRWRKLQDYYFNCIRDCDTHLVNVLDELDNLGLTEKTIIVFTSDHGELGGHHQMHGKGSSVYREQLHIPFVIKHPAYPGGKQCSALTCHLDLAPTLLGLTGLSKSRREQLLGERKGKDASVLLAAPEHAPVHAIREASLYFYSMMLYTDAEYLKQVIAAINRSDLSPEDKHGAIGKLHIDLDKRSGIRAINDGRYKFARYFSLKQHNTPATLAELLKYNDLELFDLQNDPQEIHNLALDLDLHGDLVMAMNEKLNALISQELGLDEGDYLPLAKMNRWQNKHVVIQ